MSELFLPASMVHPLGHGVLLARENIVQSDVSFRLEFRVEASKGRSKFRAKLSLIGAEGRITRSPSLEGGCPGRQKGSRGVVRSGTKA
jgi:hypothetical protein